jgi:predicted enzyme related to lactoylglutathione lyase
MASVFNPIIYPVRDLAQATVLYRTLLAVDPYAESSYYVGFRVDGTEIGLDPNGHAQGMTGPVPYHVVPDIQRALDELTKVGAQVQRPVTDVGGGKLVATVQDADGNITGLTQDP